MSSYYKQYRLLRDREVQMEIAGKETVNSLFSITSMTRSGILAKVVFYQVFIRVLLSCDVSHGLKAKCLWSHINNRSIYKSIASVKIAIHNDTCHTNDRTS